MNFPAFASERGDFSPLGLKFLCADLHGYGELSISSLEDNVDICRYLAHNEVRCKRTCPIFTTGSLGKEPGLPKDCVPIGCISLWAATWYVPPGVDGYPYEPQAVRVGLSPCDAKSDGGSALVQRRRRDGCRAPTPATKDTKV